MSKNNPVKIPYEVRFGHPRMHTKCGSARRASRRVAAEERQAEYDKLSIEEKIARCEGRHGNCAKELARLRRLAV